MKALALVLFLASATKRSTTIGDSGSPACGRPTQASESEKAIYLEEHNKYRSTIGASNMYRMEWDESLAAVAQIWANECKGTYGMLTDCDGNAVGQNIYMEVGWKSFPANDPTASVKDWYDGISDYDYENDRCTGYCGHFTQLVWSSSTKVGCGYAQCPSVTTNGMEWPNVLYTVCNYSPVGNLGGVRPYAIGTPCSECTSSDSGISCTSGLCSRCNPATDPNCVCNYPCGPNGSNDPQTCKCNCNSGYFGPQCQDSCSDCVDAADAADICATMAAYCGYPSDYLMTNCKKTCGYCPGC